MQTSTSTSARRPAQAALLAALVVAAMALGSPPALACSCAWGGPFLHVARDAPVVATVRVDAYGAALAHDDRIYASMRIAVLEVLAGDAVPSQLVVYGDPGHLCRPYVTPERFALGREYVMALHPIGAGDFAISGCGEFWLSRRDGAVHGRIGVDTEESLGYDAFRDRFRATRAD
jgi:hypothetical protein